MYTGKYKSNSRPLPRFYPVSREKSLLEEELVFGDSGRVDEKCVNGSSPDVGAFFVLNEE